MVDAWPGFSNVGGNVLFEMTFTYEGKSYSVTADTNIMEYFNYILDFEPEEGQADYSEEARKLVVNTANYIYNGLAAIDKTSAIEAELKELLDNNADRINTIDKENLPEVDLSAISKYIEGVTLAVDSYSPYFRFILTDAGRAAKITLSTGAFGDSKTKYAELGYIDTDRTHVSNLNYLTITITSDAEGETVKDSFSLIEYYTLLKDAGADDKTLAFVESMCAYYQAHQEYGSLGNIQKQ